MRDRLRAATFKDPISASTHFAGFLAAIVGGALLVVHSAHDPAKVTGMAVYGASLVALFLASSCYHFFDLGDRPNRFLQRCDHAAIFVFIGGSYAPTLLHALGGGWRLAMFSFVAAATLGGVGYKMLGSGGKRWLSVSLYLAMGWAIIIPAHHIFPTISSAAIGWMIAGGIAYTIGAVIYATKRPNPWPDVFGFHEIWHVFVLLGASAHFAMTWTYLDQPYAPF
jgi:hemolysin III